MAEVQLASSGSSSRDAESRLTDHSFGKVVQDLGRAAGGALLFSLPMLMTMEMWWLGFIMDRGRLLLLVVLTAAILFFLSRYSGFEKTRSRREDARDAALAFGVGLLTSVVILLLFGVLAPGMSWDEIAGKIVLQTVPASLGALLARSQLGRSPDDDDDDDMPRETYSGELFLMLVGALFLGFNVAPTDEMTLISYQMNAWHALGLVVLSIVCMHGFVFALAFLGGSEHDDHGRWWPEFLRFTLPGYIIALAMSFLVLWLFGRTDSEGFTQIVLAVVVLGFPSAIGAASARLVL